jgi:hypothetical protein
MTIMGQTKGQVFINNRILHLEDEWKLVIDCRVIQAARQHDLRFHSLLASG